MPSTLLPRPVLLALASLVVIAGVVGFPAGTASAHNTLLSSEPADGATLAMAPTQITWRFDRAVPLDTLTVTLIDGSGARRELAGSTHGATGDTEVVTPLPELSPGSVSIRWRLVGPDGHPITGRIDLTVAGAVAATTTTTVMASAGSAPVTVAPAVIDAPTPEGDGGFYSTPAAPRWALRYGSYVAIMAALGILLTTVLVWAAAGTDALLRRILNGSLVAVATLAVFQLLVVASDVSGRPPWAALGSIDAALSTHAGMALLIRIVLSLGMLVVLAHHRVAHPEVYWTTVSLVAVGLLGTWAFAGHARSMRWPELGVVTDVAHHAAAAAWIAGLAIVGWIVMPASDRAGIIPAVRRLSRVAAISVAVLIGTGLVQTWRLVGTPVDLLDADHGRYLAIKVAVLAGMLLLANANRRRIGRFVDDGADLDGHLHVLRRAVVAEFVIGLVIVAITAAMVVSPPATSDAVSSARGNVRLAVVYYIL